MDVGDNLVPWIGQRRPGMRTIAQEAEVIRAVDLTEGQQIDLRRINDLHPHVGAGFQQGFGAGGDFEILPHLAFLQEEFRRVRLLCLVPENFHRLLLGVSALP